MRTLGNWIALPLLVSAVLGCKSTETKDYYHDIASDLDKMQTELKDGIFKIDSVSSSLQELAGASGDLRQPFNDFNASVADLNLTAGRIRNLGSSVKTKEASFQSSWSEEAEAIDNPNLRRSAEMGRAEMEASFKTLRTKGDALANRYTEWESKIKSLQSSLQGDLSGENLKSLAGRIKELGTDSVALKEGLRSFSSDLNALATSMRSTRT